MLFEFLLWSNYNGEARDLLSELLLCYFNMEVMQEVLPLAYRLEGVDPAFAIDIEYLDCSALHGVSADDDLLDLKEGDIFATSVA